MKKRLWILPVALVALSACVGNAREEAASQARADARLEEALAGRVAGAPVNCINPSTSTGVTVTGRTVLYRESGRRTWRANLMGECPALDHAINPTLVVEQWGGQLCRGDKFRVVEGTGAIPSPYCVFASFTPYDKPSQ